MTDDTHAFEILLAYFCGSLTQALILGMSWKHFWGFLIP